MSHYFKKGNRTDVRPHDALDVHAKLPVGTYTANVCPETGVIFLQDAEPFTMPAKIYGDLLPRADRIIRTFMDRAKSTGVLLSGEKGSGKTLLSKKISVELLREGFSTVIVNAPLCGPAFNDFIRSIDEPAVILFDEFEKVYDEEEQTELLTLFDGTVETKKLFILTTNSGKIDSHLINRPGRMYYKFHYAGVDEKFVRDYAADKLVHMQHLEDLVLVANTFASFTYDMLQSMVEEMNRYGETPNEVMQCLNVDITQENVSYDLHVMYDGLPVKSNYFPTYMTANPLFNRKGRTEVEIYATEGRRKSDTGGAAVIKDHITVVLGRENLVSVTEGGTLTFEHFVKGKRVLVILKKFTGYGSMSDLF